MRLWALVAVGLAAGGVVACSKIEAKGVDLAPHKAVYAMRLASAQGGSGIAGANGEMTYEFGDACDGWTVENRTVLNFAYNEGANVATVWDFSTWESKDGLRYRFRVRSTRDGEVTEEIDGSATLKGKGKSGVAIFTKPEALTLDLPEGTIFPTEHTVDLLKTAQDGKPMLAKVLFDGTSTDGPFDVTAFIGKPAAANDNSAPPLGSSLLTGPSWHMDLAFFPIKGQQASPDYEVGLRYQDNGIARDILQNFGNFTLRGQLDKVEALKKPEC